MGVHGQGQMPGIRDRRQRGKNRGGGERTGDGAKVPDILGILTMLYVLPQDPVFGIIFKSHKAALL